MSKNRKNPMVGNKNEAPMTDPGTGQVLDNTDNKGGHLDQVEHVAGSDTRLRPGPASDPVEGNSNVETDHRDKVTVAQGGGADETFERGISLKEGQGGSSADSKDAEDAPSEEGDAPSDQASEGSEGRQAEEGAGEGEPVSSSLSEAGPAADDAASEDDGLQSSEESDAAQQDGSKESDESREDQTAPVTLSVAEAKDLSEADLRAMYSRILPEDALAGWDYNALYMYHLHRVQPEKTQRGNWSVDVRRQRALNDWSSDELLDWIDGSIKTPKGLVDDDLWDEIYKRFRMPGNWSVDAAKKYITTGERPEYTTQGVLKEDKTRDEKAVGHWTYLELRSALLGEIDSGFSKEELLEQLRKRLGLGDTYSGSRLLEQLPELPTEAHVDNVLLKSKLDEYKNAMTKNGDNLSGATAASYQVSLYKAIRAVMARETQDFFEGWNILLDWINENYSALFVDDKARRGWAQMNVSKQASSTFEDVLTLMIHTRKPGNRNTLAKVYSLDHVLRYVTSEEERSNVITYYNS